MTPTQRIEALRDSFTTRAKNLATRGDKKLNDPMWASAFDVFVVELDFLLTRIARDEKARIQAEVK